MNFNENPAAPNVKIPAHVFEYLGIPLKESYKAKDLLIGNNETITMILEQRTPLLLEGYGSKILKIKF